MENLKIWKQGEKTPPEYTKPVKFGRSYTAIDPHYQIMKATELFGPVGQGWGYNVSHSTIAADETLYAVADVTIWHSAKENVFGPIRGMSEILRITNGGKKTADADAAKKAMTDALTKGLSHIGISADVFLGKYDDNKYVDDLRKEQAQQEQEKSQADQQAAFETAISEISACATSDALKSLWAAKGKTWQRHPAFREITAAVQVRTKDLAALARAEPITDQQRKYIQAHYSGWSREDRLKNLSSSPFVGRELKSLNDMTKAEASGLIDAIEQEKKEAA